MKETGQLLKNSRLEQNISLEQVSQAIKIKVSTLNAIEEGDIEKLPPKAFIRGFVGSYAAFLHLNVNDVLDQFHREMGATVKAHELHSNESLTNDPAVQIANSQRNPFFRGIIILSILILCGIIFTTFKVINKYKEEKVTDPVVNVEPIQNENSPNIPNKESDSKKEQSNEAVTVEANSEDKEDTQPVNVEPKTDGKAQKVPTTTPEPKAVSIPNLEDKKEEPKPTPKSETKTEVKKEEIKSNPTPKPIATPTPKPEEKKEEKKEEVKATPKPEKKPSAKSQELILEALDKVRLEFQRDDGKWIKVSMSPGKLYTIKAKEKVRLKASDGGALNIIHNGKDKGVVGILGEKMDKNFPE